MTFFTTFLLTFLVVLTPVSVFANDQELYDPQISKNLVYVRFVNGGQADIRPSLNGKKYPMLLSGNVSAYYPADISTIKIGSYFSENVEGGDFYTLVLDEPVWLVQDLKSTDRSKAVLAFYNLSEQDGVSLIANDNVKVFENTQGESHHARLINGAKITLSVFHHGEIVTEEDIVIERYNHYGVFYDGRSLQIVQAKIDHNR